jgi:ribose transport system substrate-binding protein
MKKVFALILALAMSCTLFACGSSNGGSETPAGDDLSQKEIVVIVKNLTVPFWLSQKDGAEQAGKDFGVKVTVLAPTDTAEGSGNEQQTSLVEQAIAQGVSCVAIAPVDSSAIIPAIKELNDAKIPVVDLNTRISEDVYNTFVGLENYDQGYNTAKTLAEGLGGKGTVMIIEGTSGAQTSIDRVKGATAAFGEYPDIKIVAQQSANYSRADALNVVQNLLQSYPDVNGIFCCNDEMALGSVEAVSAAGLSDKILITGQDANADACTAIQNGSMYASSFGNPYMQGYTAVAAAVDILKGNEVKDFYQVETADVTKDNVADYIK